MEAARKQAVLDRILPIPINATLGIRDVELGEGTCRARAVYDPARFDGVFECFHGGLLMTVADSVACYAILSLTGPDQQLTTTDMNIRFLAPCLTDAIATARVIKLGRTMVPVAVDLHDTNGKHVAVAQVSYIRLERRPGR